MIKFFRRIRKKLLEENSFSKYLVYASGEIILVVIGIMIALQVNNYSEKKKNLASLHQTIDAIEIDLEENYIEINKALKFWKMQDSLCKRVLYDEITKEDYKSNDLASILVCNWSTFIPKAENIDKLVENEEVATPDIIPIIGAAKKLIKRRQITNQHWDGFKKRIDANVTEITKHASLIKTDSLSLEKRYEYLLNNPDYKVITELYWIDVQNMGDYLSRQRAQMMSLLSTIKVIRHNYDKDELVRLYEDYGMYLFYPIDCAMTTHKENNEIRRGYLIGNLTNKTIILKAINNGLIGNTTRLKPNEFGYTRPEYAGLDGDYTVIIEQVDEDDNCIQKHVAVNKGYLLIE